MNILAIGNSFSQDATRYLHGIARSMGKKWNTAHPAAFQIPVYRSNSSPVGELSAKLTEGLQAPLVGELSAKLTEGLLSTTPPSPSATPPLKGRLER